MNVRKNKLLMIIHVGTEIKLMESDSEVFSVFVRIGDTPQFQNQKSQKSISHIK